MNREIKFRFWGEFGALNEDSDKCEKEMLYGDEFCFFSNEPIDVLFADKTIVVMQFTGLKDKNDQEIYEGDVVYFEYNLIDKVKVIFHDGKYNICNYVMSKCTVIGNIYENPELL